ncbi:NADH-quinone oxidoreductase subunit NuoG [candidate division GN15 bacterium]|nr:NADH-quinone oxidoreductase subunit NuoG [candidate division GN15 bacterium]
MPYVYIDGKKFEVADGQNMLQVALSLGFDLPYFCWHPAFGSVGACRQCAVMQYKDENDEKGKLAMACMVPATEGTRISIKARQAEEFRKSVIEWLMVNHPHDCPVCDEGGECHLQDMTVMTGHTYREFRFKKRTHRNQDLGPFINHEMNRCIACYRCVRFYHDFAGGDDLQAFAAHDHVYFGRYEDGPLESEFSGNLVEVCPTGVFTDKTLKQHYARKWDLQTAPSVCHQCSLGCNIIPGSRYDKVVRVLNRYNREVNGYFMCDRGRFGYEFVNSPDRITNALSRTDRSSDFEQVDDNAALDAARKSLGEAKGIAGIGSPRASLEANFALRELVGQDNFYSGDSERQKTLTDEVLTVLRNGPARSASLHDVEQADVVLILGEDLTNTAPMLDLAVRQAGMTKPAHNAKKIGVDHWHDAAVRELMQGERGPCFVATPTRTKLDKFSTRALRASAEDITRIGFAIAATLDDKAPAVAGLSDETLAFVEAAAEALREADRPVVISGTSLGSRHLIHAAANTAFALCKEGNAAELAFVLPETNSLGVSFLDAPSVDEAFEKITRGDIDTLVILENDLYRRIDRATVDSALNRCKRIIALDHIMTDTTGQADVVIPVAAFTEGDGTLVNNEGRAQRFYQVLSPGKAPEESWRRLLALAGANRRNGTTLDDICSQLFDTFPAFGDRLRIAPGARFRLVHQRIPRASHRYSGRTAMTAHINVHEPQPKTDPDSPLAFSMEGYHGKPPSSLIPFFWAPGWNSVQATAKYQAEVGGPLRGGDPGLRLIEPRPDAARSYFQPEPKTDSSGNKPSIVPMYHIYGSEELSSRAAALATRMPEPYIAIPSADRESHEVSEGDMLSLTIGNREFQAKAVVRDDLPTGTIGIPIGLGPFVGIDPNASVEIARGVTS